MSETSVLVLVGTLLAIGLGGLAAVFAGTLVRSRRRKAEEGQRDESGRKIFYISVALFVGGFLLMALTIVYNSWLFGILGLIGFVGGIALRWHWWIRKLLGKP